MKDDPESSQTILFQSFVLCDDVRYENNGKLLLIGVYSDVVQVLNVPLQLRSLGFAVKARVFSTGRFSFGVALTDPQGNKLLEAQGEAQYEGEVGRVIWLPVVTGPALLPTEGVYSVRIALGENPPVQETFVVRKAALPEVQLSQTKPN